LTISRFAFPTTIHFGPGARSLVGPHLAEAGVRRPLVVTDKGVSGLSFFAALLDGLRGEGLEPAPFDGVWGNPVVSQVEAGSQAFAAHGADAIVGVGGGAALDVAKAIGVLATHDGHLLDYEDEKPGARPVGPIPHFVALPTTAGTGSEVGRSAVIADDDTHVKRIVFSPELLARAVYADPELTVGLPPAITAATGLDALTHCVEAYLAKDFHPICDGIALEGLRIAAAQLPRAVADGADLEARGGMLMASMMGAIAFQKGLGLVHSCAHALGTATDLHHGLANGLMIDHALAHNTAAVPDRFATMAQTVGLAEHTPTAFLRWLRELKTAIGVPATLTEQGIGAERLDELVRLAVEDGCHANNPTPVSADDFRRVFGAALS
jgi:alcohol dehydrogenase class IV